LDGSSFLTIERFGRISREKRFNSSNGTSAKNSLPKRPKHHNSGPFKSFAIGSRETEGALARISSKRETNNADWESQMTENAIQNPRNDGSEQPRTIHQILKDLRNSGMIDGVKFVKLAGSLGGVSVISSPRPPKEQSER